MIKDVVDAVKRALPARRPIEHHEPWFDGYEGLAINGCQAKGFIGHHYVKKFEERLSEITGVEQVVAMCSGTAALHMALEAVGIEACEEVLVPSSTFVGSANAVKHAGAIPHFIDGGWYISPSKLRDYLYRATLPSPYKRGRINKKTGRTISGLIVVHVFGFPSPIEELTQIANKNGIVVIEDAAEAIGSMLGNRMCGGFGAASIFSFNNNKTITTNGGGALLTNDPWVASKAWQLSTTARVQHPWEVSHNAVAWNYRMPNLNAALGVGQLLRFDDIIAAKRKLARNYLHSFAGVGGCKLLGPSPWWSSSPNYWLNTLILDQDKTQHREGILKALHEEGIKARAAFTPLHRLVMYRDNPRSDVEMPQAESFYQSAICLPSGPRLAHEDSSSIH